MLQKGTFKVWLLLSTIIGLPLQVTVRRPVLIFEIEGHKTRLKCYSDYHYTSSSYTHMCVHTHTMILTLIYGIASELYHANMLSPFPEAFSSLVDRCKSFILICPCETSSCIHLGVINLENEVIFA